MVVLRVAYFWLVFKLCLDTQACGETQFRHEENTEKVDHDSNSTR
jgi:hypothetical protein